MRNRFVPILLLLMAVSIIITFLALPIYLRFVLDFGFSLLLIIFILIPSALFFLYKFIKSLPIIDFIKPVIFIALMVTIPIFISNSIAPLEQLAVSQYFNNNKSQILNLVNYAERIK